MLAEDCLKIQKVFSPRGGDTFLLQNFPLKQKAKKQSKKQNEIFFCLKQEDEIAYKNCNQEISYLKKVFWGSPDSPNSPDV